MHFTRRHNRLKLKRLKIAVLATIISLFFMPVFTPFESKGDNLFTIYINGSRVGLADSLENAEEALLMARKEVNAQSEELTFLEAELSYEGEEVLWGEIDSREDLVGNMKNVLSGLKEDSLEKAYEVKINSYTVILDSYDDVNNLLQAAIDKYDETNTYRASLRLDETRELPVLIPSISTVEDEKALEEAEEKAGFMAGFDQDMINLFEEIQPERELSLEEYDTGLLSMDFKDPVEVAQVYVNKDQLTDFDTAVKDVTEEELHNDVYKVVAGDTLIGISLKVNIPMDDIIAMNNMDENNLILHVDEELVITVPKPKLTVIRNEVLYYEENYSEEPIITLNPDWYTTDVVVHVQPSDGHRKVVANVTFENNEKVDTDIIAQQVTMKAVAKEMEKGEKIPPSYIKPISGGRMSSTFGYRNRPTKGASSYHKGIDWAVSTGTPVYASCGGTVYKAGWGSGYGYCVFINHPDGRQTRYGHLSKVLVSAGQSVSQGQRIALSGNTGVSTGPHLHFEILIGGTQVNPLKYIGQ